MNKTELNNIILQEILQHTNIGIHVIDNQGQTLIYNQAMADLEGLEVKQVIGKDILKIFPSLDAETSTLIKVIDSGEAITNSIQTYLNYRGHSITTISSTIPLLSGGTIIGALEIANNLTNLKSLSDQIMELQDELNISKKRKSSKGLKINKYNLAHIIGNSKNLELCKDIAKKASNTTSSVLIYGETGTGKEMFAQSIHNEGIRKNYPFIAQNCAAIPESLLEGILFGTDKGGFTGAIERAGIFEQAKGGTLLLDEINSMSMGLQAKLLRVLQEGYIRRVGGVKDIPVDVRIIATTNEDPLKAIEGGSLRKDLYYRLSVINISIPPLRKRLEDLPLLCSHFIDKYNYILNKDINDIDLSLLKRFNHYHWPGNIRELENIIEGAMNMVSYDKKILDEEEFLSTKFIDVNKDDMISQLKDKSLPDILASMEKEMIFKVLDSQDNNITQAAKQLGVKRQTLQHKIKRYK